MIATRITYGMAGFSPGTPNGAGVPGTLAPKNITEYRVRAEAGLNAVDAANNTVAMLTAGGPGVTLHYAGPESTAAWSVNGVTQTLTTSLVSPADGGDGTLRESAITVTASAAGPILVTCNGASLTLTAT